MFQTLRVRRCSLTAAVGAADGVRKGVPTAAAHTPIVAWGSVLGRRTSPPAPLLLHDLMPHPAGAGHPHRFVAGAAGTRHLTLLTSEGNLIMMGNNKYGQVGQPTSTERHDEEKPQSYDLDFSPTEAPTSVACGTNFNIIFRRGTLRAVVIGCNTYGQLGAGHKNALNNLQGFGEWNEDAPWWRGVGAGLRDVACGHNHTFFQLEDGRIFACGSNMRGELGIGSLVSPMAPKEVTFFREHGITISRIAAGCSFSLFLAEDGRVFGCGNHSSGQVERDDKYLPRLLRVSRDPILAGHKAKLMRAKDIACMGDMSVVLTRKDEIFVKGGVHEYGFDSPHLFFQVQVPPAVLPIDRIAATHTTTYVIGRNGAVFGFGGNAEGQLFMSPGKVNVAPTFVINEAVEVFPPLATAPAADGASKAPHSAALAERDSAPFFIFASGYGMVVDPRGGYPIGTKAAPLQFPQPLPLVQRKKRVRMKF